MKKEIIPILIIFITTILVTLPLRVNGFYTIHDDQQIARLFLLNDALQSGQFPPRWVDELGFGFGYPLFNFYPPLAYYLGEVFHLLGFSFVDSVKLVFFSSFLLSGVTMYIFVKDLWGKLAGTIASIFYLLLPYRAIDVYIRGAMAESFSFVWLPLIVWSFYKLRVYQKSRYLIFSSVSLSLLMITHNLIVVPFLLILPFYLTFLIFIKANKIKFIFFQIPIVFFLLLSFSAYFWLPAITEKKFTLVDDLLLVNLANYNIHFVYPQQLWNWPWGFGGSAEGLNDGISFKIGKIHIIVSFFSIIILGAFLLIRKTRPNIKYHHLQIPVLFFLLVISAFMSTIYSKIFWDMIEPLGYLQFPWRFLILTGLFSSVLAGALIFLVKVPIFKIISGLLLVITLFVTNLKLFKPQTFRTNLTDANATSKDTIQWQISSSSFEYIPKGVETYKSELGTNLVNISKTDLPKDKIEFLSGSGQIETLLNSPHKNMFLINNQSSAKLKANIYNFPGWQVKVDGIEVPINDQNRLKLITFNVPSGNHRISIEFTNTPVRLVANLITLISAVAALVFFSSKKWTKTLF